MRLRWRNSQAFSGPRRRIRRNMSSNRLADPVIDGQHVNDTADKPDPAPASVADGSVVMVTTRMGNHAGPSGYDHLCGAIDAQVMAVHRPRGRGARAMARLLAPLARRSGSQWYDRNCALAELEAGAAWLARSNTLFHFLYGENCVRYLPALTRRSPRNRLVATFHTPGWRMNEVVRERRSLRWLDAVVVMSNSQLPYWSDVVGPDRVAFVPHGVDTGYFRPAAVPGRESGPVRFLTVGHHLRDFEVLAEVARDLAASHPDVEFAVVARPDRMGPLAGLANVSCHSGLSDAALRSLYQTCTALLLPLRDATANNALLEGMACGTPVIATDIQGVRDYAAPQGTVFCPHEAGAFAEAVRAIHGGRFDLAAMAGASRRRAESLSWPMVGARMVRVYEKILTSGDLRTE